MDSTITFFSLPFVDAEAVDLGFSDKHKDSVDVYDDIQTCLPSHEALLDPDDIAQFLSADEPLEEPDLNGPTTLHCEICSKQFDNAKKYYGHLRVHSKGNLWVCDKCPDQKFSTKQQWMKHGLTHEPLKRVWRCQQCSMSFEALWRLQQHLFAKHKDYRPHKCDKCPKAFHKPSDLKKHQFVHEGIKNHKCPQCKAAFRDKSNLTRHLVTHSQGKNFCCVKCGNRYQQLASLNRHKQKCVPFVNENTEKGIRKNHCRLCGMTFQYKGALLEHTIRYHSDSTKVKDSDTTKAKYSDSTKAKDSDSTKVKDSDSTKAKDSDCTKAKDSDSTKAKDSDSTKAKDSDSAKAKDSDSYKESKEKEVNNKEIFTNPDATLTYENIVNDILSAEDDFIKHKEIDLRIKKGTHDVRSDIEKQTQIEFLKDMHQLHNLDDELFYNDLDLESFTSNYFDYSLPGHNRNNEVQFELTEAARSVDQDIMNALYNVRAEHLPDELLDVGDFNNITAPNPNPAVTMSECATIFEKDVDLEASTNLAANLNQLIGENNVQYISTEDDDTFIISLNSAIDAEQLSDMLNIGVEFCNEDEGKEKSTAPEKYFAAEEPPIVIKLEGNIDDDENDSQDEHIVINLDRSEVDNVILDRSSPPLVINLEGKIVQKNNCSTDKSVFVKVDDTRNAEKTNIVIEKDGKKPEKENYQIDKNIFKKYKKVKRTVMYICNLCEKAFIRKHNYRSHMATHDASLRQYKCQLCDQWFSYQSTLRKHCHKMHEPRVLTAHTCHLCDKTFRQNWLLKTHLKRDHEGSLRYVCDHPNCEKRFYKKCDLDVHKRYHTGERPYNCKVCDKKFTHVSHLRRHEKHVDCTRLPKR